MPEGNVVPRRDRILAAAASEFARHGFSGARVERIAGSAGVNKQLLFHYFGSKTGLHRAALKSLLERSVPTPQVAQPPADRLRELTAQLLTTTEAHPAVLALLAAQGGDPETAAIADDWRDRAKRQVQQILLDGQRAGYIRDDAEVDTVSELVVGAMFGWTAAGDRGTAGRRERYQETLLRMAMEYCAWR